MKYKDLQNKVHDIQDGFQHLMAGWPNGYTEITEVEAAILLTPPPPTIAETNAIIQSQLDEADRKIIRALVENDQVRLTAHKASQALLRAQLK